jgi:prolyl 4-hydroxylase
VQLCISKCNELYEMKLFAGEELRQVHSAAAAFPQEEDLRGAANALFRLQDTYALDARDLAHGRLPGARHSTNMTGMP